MAATVVDEALPAWMVAEVVEHVALTHDGVRTWTRTPMKAATQQASKPEAAVDHL